MTKGQHGIVGMLAVAILVGLAGCSNPALTLRNLNAAFMSRDVDEFFLAHGAPIDRHELNSGAAIYTWRSAISTVRVPGSSYTTGSVSEYGTIHAYTRSRGGYSVQHYCELELLVDSSDKIRQIRLKQDTRGTWEMSRFAELFKGYDERAAQRKLAMSGARGP